MTRKFWNCSSEPPPPRRFRRALQLVRPVLVETPLRLGAAQAARGVGPECRDDRFNRFTVRRRRNVCVGRAQPGRVFGDVILPARLGKGLQHWSSCAHEVSMRWRAGTEVGFGLRRRAISAAQPGIARAPGISRPRHVIPISRTPCPMVPGAICATVMDTIAWGMATSVQWKSSLHPLPASRTGPSAEHPTSVPGKGLAATLAALPIRPEIEISC